MIIKSLLKSYNLNVFHRGFNGFATFVLVAFFYEKKMDEENNIFDTLFRFFEFYS